MAYKAQLINRLAQYGSVSYDFLIEDDAGILPTRRVPIKLRDADDTSAKWLQLRNATLTRANYEESAAGRRERKQERKQAVVDRIRANVDEKKDLESERDKLTEEIG